MIHKNWAELIKPTQLDVRPGNDPLRQATVVAEPLDQRAGGDQRLDGHGDELRTAHRTPRRRFTGGDIAGGPRVRLPRATLTGGRTASSPRARSRLTDTHGLTLLDGNG